MRHHSIVEGVTTHYAEGIASGGSKAADRFMAEYTVKGPITEYVFKVLRDNELARHWCPLFTAVQTVSILDQVSEILDVKGSVLLFGLLEIPTKLRLFRSAFYDK